MTQTVSGNKFRKMKYNLLYMKKNNIKTLLTLGGAFSNHIHATAAAGRLLGIKTIGVIRGEETAPSSLTLSPTLRFARDCGMLLHFVSRADYREKDVLINSLKAQFGDFYYLPEGGTNDLALRGTAEIVGEIEAQLDGISPDFICVPCGTGGTIAGIISAAKATTHVLGFSALKGDFLQNEVTNLLNIQKNAFYTEGVQPLISNEKNLKNNQNWSINTDFHCGGYARWTPELIDFINRFKEKHNIALDPVYTGKMIFGLYKLIESGAIPPNSTIVAVHTGGLQGIEGFNQRFGNLINV
ncbi:MAG: pyridoxal-phosphate dependent enzyme [Saprospiraceae bacterium]|nr:pyridoxal-phosphate dependent enzyme [Saprospiraceae bacterium]